MNSSDRRKAVKILRRFALTPKISVEDYREKFDEAFSTVFLPNGVESSKRRYGVVDCDILNPTMYASGRMMIYVHGGSFVGGSKKAYRNFVASLANATSCRTVLPEYRLAPAHPSPAALEDLQQVFRYVYTEEQIAKSLENPDAQPEIIIAADGAGASIALALVLSLKDKYREAISHVLLFSPWLDLSPDSPKFTQKKVCDEILSAENMNRAADFYTYADNRSSPYVSPLKATDEQLAGFPPVFIQMGEKEILLDDVKKYKSLLENAGGSCVIDVWPDMMHMFQMADEYLPQAHLALEKAGKLITAQKYGEADSERKIGLELEKSDFSL